VLVNNTTCATAEAVLMDPAGREVLVLVAKAGYRWGQGAELEPLQPSPAVVAADSTPVRPITGAPVASCQGR
jgi:hypothetical protein